MPDKMVSVIIPTYDRENEVLACVSSFCRAEYPHLEIIVVDNASRDNTVRRLSSEFPAVKVVRLPENFGASVARNEGVKHALGEYVCFVDSDNIVDGKMLSELVRLAETDEKIGFVGPKMRYFKDPKRLWYAGADINLLTSRTKYLGINEIDNGQYDVVREVGHIPNLWLVRKAVIEKIGLIDTSYVMHYEESDWAMRTRLAGYRIMFCPTAVTYHNIPQPESGTLRGTIGFDNTYRIFYAARNRVLFMKKYSGWIKFLAFILVFNNVFLFKYCIILLRHKRTDLMLSYFRGYMSGFGWLLRRTT
jgi:GT2 family glycosyltransferase